VFALACLEKQAFCFTVHETEFETVKVAKGWKR